MAEIALTSPPRSVRKRILFPASPASSEHSSGSLGHMSPLGSTPDRYSSPPHSPESPIDRSPTKKTVPSNLSSILFGNLITKIETPSKDNQQASPQRRSPRLAKLCKCSTPENVSEYGPEASQSTSDHASETSEHKVINDCMRAEIIPETPEKETDTETGLLTPFKVLQRVIQETPTPKDDSVCSREGLVGLTTPSKSMERKKRRLLEEAGHTEEKVSNLPHISVSSFYSAPRARASLFQDHSTQPGKESVLAGKRSASLSCSTKQPSHRRSTTNSRSRSSSMRSKTKRIKAGEINAGVHHSVQRPRPKKARKHSPKLIKANQSLPKILPEDRVLSYVVSTGLQSPSPNQKRAKRLKSSPARDSSPSSDYEQVVTSPSPDPTKKFFKTNRTLEINRKATVTVGKNIRIKVKNGKFSLEKKSKTKQKKQTPEDKMLNHPSKGTDVVVFEPLDDNPNKAVAADVANILQQLEAEEPSVPDESTAANKSNVHDKPNVSNVLMSPASQITDITTSTSAMAIVDKISPEQHPVNDLNSKRKDGVEEIMDTNENSVTAETGANETPEKYFSLFYKGTVKHKLSDVTNKKILHNAKRPKLTSMNNQYIIDAGQKLPGPKVCPECMLVYCEGNAEDELSHRSYHNKFKILKFQGWKEERVAKTFDDGRVVVIHPGDSKVWLRKAQEVVAAVDLELGFPESSMQLDGKKVYLFVANKQVAGCLVAEQIASAHRMLSNGTDGPDACSEEAFTVQCGVSRLWVSPTHRRKRVAARLMDCLRASFLFGTYLAISDVAFSAPTPVGKEFATHYCGTQEFLVYM